ncbi:unnamed protein product [Arctogadus glacialis]
MRAAVSPRRHQGAAQQSPPCIPAATRGQHTTAPLVSPRHEGAAHHSPPCIPAATRGQCCTPQWITSPDVLLRHSVFLYYCGLSDELRGGPGERGEVGGGNRKHFYSTISGECVHRVTEFCSPLLSPRNESAPPPATEILPQPQSSASSHNAPPPDTELLLQPQSSASSHRAPPPATELRLQPKSSASSYRAPAPVPQPGALTPRLHMELHMSLRMRLLYTEN